MFLMMARPRSHVPSKASWHTEMKNGNMRAGIPLMFVLAPIVDEQLQVVAMLGLKIRPEREFTRILQLGQLGNTGETYAFDASGLLLSNTSFRP